MDPTPLDPKDLASNKPQPTGAGAIDLDKILLPKKEPPNTERINAGVLLEQELSATLAPTTQPVQDKVPTPPPEKAPESSSVKSLETYKGDIESAVQDKGASILSIASAEAKRRERAPILADVVPRTTGGGSLWTTLAMVLGGTVLVGLAGAVIFLVITRPTTVPIEQTAAAPFIMVDSTAAVPVAPGITREEFMQALTNAAGEMQLSLGLVGRLYPTVASTSGATVGMDAQTFLSTLAPDIPPTLLRNIAPTFLLGVHSFAGNQPFLLLSVDSYEEGYAGMLAWEPDVQADLAPLFTYTPSPHIPEENLPAVATTTASSTLPAGTNAVLPAETPFTDQIVDNHDARVITDQSGDILFLWTFLDRSTIVITTNPNTLSEIISRLETAPVNALPQNQ